MSNDNLHESINDQMQGIPYANDSDNEEDEVDELKIKEKLLCSWKKLNERNDSIFTELQTDLFNHFNKSLDVLFTNRSVENSKEIRQIYALHALNHIFKEFRDQGFTRPKVLILLPFRNSALNLAEIIIKLSGAEQQENRKRFFDSYGISPDEETIDLNKPADFLETFKGNIDDMFRIGIKFTRKSIKFYAEFYNADIILASPLGLRMIIGNEGEKKHDFDFLSSIEILIMDQCEIFLMQNWDHIEYIFNHLNLIPKKSHNCDFSRVKNWYLDGKAKYYRQTIIISSYLTPEINSLFNKQMLNLAGKLKIKDKYEGTIVDVIPRVKQIFTRIESSLIEADDTRFKYFIEKSLPALQKLNPKLPYTLIFIPSYFDFIRIRNYFEDNDYNFTSICEYTPAPDVTRARSHFLNGKRNIMLYTERFYFFRRYQIRGTRHILFYALPDHPQFYPEIVNFLISAKNETDSDSNLSCNVIFSKFDQFRLERIVGSERVNRMITSDKHMFLFT
ncbi:digestive organ expansion factor [Gigaspora rosea]|uniref:U3 small nucleolar RNA-associated protein 25 n=1 Tax=Gigaspora rosea TaxID=44941 RepID=A0A397W2F4_9GLOM|nr:digestive organ expansion factor [Gigaspora rosea]